MSDLRHEVAAALGDVTCDHLSPLAVCSDCQADALLPLIERKMAEAWDEGHRLTAPHGDRCEPTCPNPYKERA